MPPTQTLWRVVGPVLALVLAVGGFLWFIPQTKLDRSSLAGLVLTNTSVPGLTGRAKLSQVVDPSTSAFAATKSAGKRDPDHTGLYAREWYVSSSSPPEVGIVLQVLPDVATALAVDSEVRAQLSTKPVLRGDTATEVRTFRVPRVPGASGTAFALVQTGTTATAGYAYKTQWQVGRSVLSELAVVASPKLTLGPIEADMEVSAHLLKHDAPPSSFSQRHFPAAASWIYVVLAVVVVAGVALVPERTVRLVVTGRDRRRAHAEAQARSQYLARGRRVVRGRGAPPWSQPRKR